MSKIKVNTDSINALAENMASINNNHQSDFDAMIKETNKLSQCWNSNAGHKAVEAFSKIHNIEKEHFEIINNMIYTLKKDIVEGLEVTENHQKSLAERFK